MSDRRYWVIGGEFLNGTFEEIDTKTARVLGPYSELQAAEAAWRDLSRQHGHEHRTRFTVVTEPLRRAAVAA
jgi:hypothetical protein